MCFPPSRFVNINVEWYDLYEREIVKHALLHAQEFICFKELRHAAVYGFRAGWSVVHFGWAGMHEWVWHYADCQQLWLDRWWKITQCTHICCPVWKIPIVGREIFLYFCKWNQIETLKISFRSTTILPLMQLNKKNFNKKLEVLCSNTD